MLVPLHAEEKLPLCISTLGLLINVGITVSSNPLDTFSATINTLPNSRQQSVPVTIRQSAINITTEVQWLGLRFFFFFFLSLLYLAC